MVRIALVLCLVTGSALAGDAERLDVAVGETIEQDVGFAIGLLCDDLTIVHPELRADTLRDLIDSRAGDLRSEGLDPAPLRAGVRETESARLLRAFADEARRS